MENETQFNRNDAEYFAKTPIEAFSFSILIAQDRALRHVEAYNKIRMRSVKIKPVEMIASITTLWNLLRALFIMKNEEEYKTLKALVESEEPENLLKAFESLQLFIYRIGVTRIDTLRLPKDPTNPFSVDRVLRGIE